MPQMVGWIFVSPAPWNSTLMRYFLCQSEERNPEVHRNDFRLSWTKPQTSEAGVVSIADSCEAAVCGQWIIPQIRKIKEFVSEGDQRSIS